MHPDNEAMTMAEWERRHEIERKARLAEAKTSGKPFSEVLKIAID